MIVYSPNVLDVFPEQFPLILPKQRDTDHRIELVEGTKPPDQRIYCMMPEQKTELKQKLENYLAAGQIE